MEFLSSAWVNAVVWFSGLGVVFLFMRKMFKDADEELDPEKRQYLADQLVRKNWTSGSWVPYFTLVFDRFFGKKHLRWHCIYRSIIISVVSFYFVVILHSGFKVKTLGFVLTAIFINAFIGYWSLLETRYLLNWSMPTRFKLLLDIIITFLLCIAWTSFLISLFDDQGFWAIAVELLGAFFDLDDQLGSFVRIIVATSFTTSIWLWLHGLSLLTIKCLSGAGFLMSWLNVKERPLRAVGTVVNLLVLLIGVLLFPLFAIL